MTTFALFNVLFVLTITLPPTATTSSPASVVERRGSAASTGSRSNSRSPPTDDHDLDRERGGTRWWWWRWGALCLATHALGQALSIGSNGNIVAVIVRTAEFRRAPSSVPILALAFSDLALSFVWHVTAIVQLSAGLQQQSSSSTYGSSRDGGGSGGGGGGGGGGGWEAVSGVGTNGNVG